MVVLVPNAFTLVIIYFNESLFFFTVASAANGEPHTMSARSNRPRSKHVRIAGLGQTSKHSETRYCTAHKCTSAQDKHV